MHIRILFLFLGILIFESSCKAQEIRVYKEPIFANDWSKPSIHPDRIILNPGQNPSSEMNVTWRTTTEIEVAYAEIAPATAAPKFWRNAQTYTAKTENLNAKEVPMAEVEANYHSVEFKNLQPGQLYGYRVGDGEHWSEWFQFKTASADPKERFSFLYVGDAQNYILELWARLIREGYRKAPDADFIIHAGDLINYAHREQEWHEWFTAGGFIHSCSLPFLFLVIMNTIISITPIERPEEHFPFNGSLSLLSLKTVLKVWKKQPTLSIIRMSNLFSWTLTEIMKSRQHGFEIY